MFDPDSGMPRLNRSMAYLGACLIAGIRLARERQVNVRVTYIGFERLNLTFLKADGTMFVTPVIDKDDGTLVTGSLTAFACFITKTS